MKEYPSLKATTGAKYLRVSTSGFLYMDGLRIKTYFLEFAL